MIGSIFSLLIGSFLKGDGATKAAGAFNGLALYGSIAGGALWLLGPGREWSITLNGLELSGVCLGAALLLEFVRRLPPPPPPGPPAWR